MAGAFSAFFVLKKIQKNLAFYLIKEEKGDIILACLTGGDTCL